MTDDKTPETKTETEDKFPAFPFDEDLTKADMVDHLRDVHGINHMDGHYLSKNTKVTKNQLIRAHTKMHVVLDDPRARAGYPNEHYTGFFDEEVKHQRYTMTPITPHTHEVIVLPENADDMVERAKNNEPVSEKPLSATERRVLTDLVNNDFKALEQEMRQFAADLLKTKLDEIKTTWQERVDAAPAFASQARQIAEKAQREFEELKAEAKREGVEFKATYGLAYNFNPITEVEGYARAIKEAQDENTKMLQRGLLTLERQRLTAQRRVLISGVTRQAATLLDELPKAKDLMVQAAADEAGGRAIPAPKVT